MKHFLIALLSIISITTYAQCPVAGSSTEARLQHLDSLKNRTDVGKKATKMDVSDFLIGEFDESNVSTNDYVAMTGYIVGCKWGGKETAECHEADQNSYDIHIEIAASPNETDKKKMMVVEMTRFTRNGIALSDIKELIGKHVVVTGWLFVDEEHLQNSYDVNPDGNNDWRGTPIEIHPVVSIVEK